MSDLLTTTDLNNGVPWGVCPTCFDNCYGLIPHRKCVECGWDEQKHMTDAQRTMREENWMLTDELHSGARPEPPEVTAYRVLRDEDWVEFVMDTENNQALRFFNPEQREFSPAQDWDELCEMQGIAPYAKEWSIPATLTEAARDFCRELRNDVLARGDEDTKGHHAFHDPKGGLFETTACCVLVVSHPPDTALESYFKSMGEMEGHTVDLLRARKLVRIRMGVVTHIYPA